MSSACGLYMMIVKSHLRLIALVFFFMVPASPILSQLDTSVKTNGDINGDGVFDTLDLILLEQIVITKQKGTEDQLKRCDVDGNGSLTSYDPSGAHRCL